MTGGYSLAEGTNPEKWLGCPKCGSGDVEKVDQWYYGQTYKCDGCGEKMAWAV